MPDGGWIPLWRKAFDCHLSPKKRRLPYTEFEAWLDLLCRAVQKSEGVIVKGAGMMPVKLEAGEILCSYRGLQADWRWGSHHKVRRYCAALCEMGMIAISSHRPTRLKILNAKRYGLVRPNKRDKSVPEASHARPTDVPIQQEEQVLNKEKQGKTKKKVPSPAAPASHISFLDSWNKSGFKKARKLTASRTQQLRARMKDDDWRDNWEKALQQLVQSPFANGENDRGWIADIDFFLRPDTVTRILEDKYKSKKPMTVSEQLMEEYQRKQNEL